MQPSKMPSPGTGRNDPPEGPTIREKFILNLEHGLHARPCALLVKTLQPFRSRVEVEVGREKADGHSIMGLMILGATNKSVISFAITGRDAEQAMAAVRHLFETRFESAYQPPTAHNRPS